jgi:hypothetical protein
MVCPQCHGDNVIPFQRQYAAARKEIDPPLPVWACLNFACLHTWPREFVDEVA